MFKTAPNEVRVSAKRLRLACRNRCRKWNLVETKTLYEDETRIKQLFTFRDMDNNVLYQIVHSGLKKVQLFNGQGNLTLVRKNKREE